MPLRIIENSEIFPRTFFARTGFYKGRRIFLSIYFEIKERKVDRKDSFSRVNLANFGIEKKCIEVDPKFTLFYLIFFKSISKYLKFRASSNRT